jgi:hypothetical protein
MGVMTLSLTCACGVHLEVDETFAGQTITCPDCHRSLRVPDARQAPRRTSGLALASLVLALAGAFTVVGTLLAVLLGGLALLAINRQREQLTGKGLAVAGIVLGLGLTGLSLFAYTSVELFGLDTLLREPQWAGKLDFDGPLEVDRGNDGFVITRPSRKWGVYRNPRPADHLLAFPPPQSLLLVNLQELAYVTCVPMQVADTASLEDCRARAEREFADLDLTSGAIRGRLGSGGRLEIRATRNLPPKYETERVEMLVVKKGRGPEKTYLLRVEKRPQDELMYLVAGGARSDRFARLEAEIRQALDSFRVIDRGRPREFQNR